MIRFFKKLIQYFNLKELKLKEKKSIAVDTLFKAILPHLRQLRPLPSSLCIVGEHSEFLALVLQKQSAYLQDAHISVGADGYWTQLTLKPLGLVSPFNSVEVFDVVLLNAVDVPLNALKTQVRSLWQAIKPGGLYLAWAHGLEHLNPVLQCWRQQGIGSEPIVTLDIQEWGDFLVSCGCTELVISSECERVPLKEKLKVLSSLKAICFAYSKPVLFLKPYPFTAIKNFLNAILQFKNTKINYLLARGKKQNKS